MLFSRTALLVGVIAIYLMSSCGKRNSLSGIPPIPDNEDTAVIADPDTLPGGPGYSQKAINTVINEHCGGFYEALPPAYDSSEARYPLLVFIHGGGELGNGASDLPLILKNAVPKMLSERKFPVSFASGDTVFSFIIISPQFNKWPVPADVEAVVNYAKAHYRVNDRRVYIAGLSMGGGVTWEYAAVHGADLAAIVPLCGASWPDSAATKRIAQTNVPAWAFHNKDDSAVTVLSTTKYVNMINMYNPDPLVRMTLWDTGGHDAWTRATDPSYKEEGKNIYEWMLQYTR